MEAEKSNRRSVKRKPLSDRTNIIPSSTVLKLSSPPLFSKSSNPKSNPVQIPKPFNSSSKPCKQSTNSSKSRSSVGSTNNSTTKNDQIRVPQSHPSTPITKPLLHSESTNHGNENDEIIEPLIVYRRKPTAEKTGSKGDTVAVPFSYPLLEKTNNKGSVEKTKDKGKAIAVPFNIPNVGIVKDKQKEIALPLDISALLKRKDKGKAIPEPFSVPTFGKTKDLEKISNGKATDKIFSSVKRNDKAKGNDRGRGFSAAFSSSPLKKTRCNEPDDEDNGLLKFQTDPHLKHKKKRRTNNAPTYELPKEFVEKQRAYFKEIDEFELPVEEASDEESK